MSTLAQSLDLLQSTDPRADLTEALDSILSGADSRGVDPQTFEAAFRVFERHPLCDFGSPGPLVHWLERAYPKYISALEASIERRPTEHTLWMVNRILNSKIEAPTRASLVSLLKAAANRADVEHSTVAFAKEWLEAHA